MWKCVNLSGLQLIFSIEVSLLGIYLKTLLTLLAFATAPVTATATRKTTAKLRMVLLLLLQNKVQNLRIGKYAKRTITHGVASSTSE